MQAGDIFAFLIAVFLFGSVALLLYKYFNGRHKERMTIIEKGLNPMDYQELYKRQFMWASNPLTSLKWGLLAVFVGLGIFSGATLIQFAKMHESVAVALAIMWGGAGLIVYYLIAAKKMKEQEPRA